MSNLKIYKTAVLYLGAFLFLVSCTSVASKRKPKKKKHDQKVAQLYAKTYDHINWKEKHKIFSNFRSIKIHSADDVLFRKGFNDKSSDVVLAVFRGVGSRKIERYRDIYVQLLNHPSSIVRYKAYLQIANLRQVPENIAILKRGLKDTEWMIRELSLRIIRLHPAEREKKKLYYNVLFSLSEKNSRVLRQTYKTLKWYRTERVIPYLYKRSFISENELELVYIIRELSSLKNTYKNKIKRRLISLRDNSESILVRNAARKALLKQE